jgi:tripartite-type tricarboxylate transporter receptor subunit TctC
MSMRKLIAPALALAAIASAPLHAPAAAEADVFKGKTMKIVIPYGPGGTYDLYGQTFAKNLGRFLPGNPNIIVVHMPGAGGTKAMNWSYTVMAKDGLNMIVPLDNSVVNQLLQPGKLRYDARNYNWIGSSNQTNIVMVVRSDTGVKAIGDMKGKNLVGSSAGATDTSYIGSRLAAAMLGFKVKMVPGYKGSNAAIFAIEQGEAHFAMYNWLAWVSRSKWFEGDKPFVRPILQIGFFKDPDLPADVAMLSDLVKNPEDRKVIDFIASLGVLGRGLAAPPGVAADRVAMLRKAYDAMNADKDFAADLKKRKLRLVPSDGAKIQEIVVAAVNGATPEVVARARKMIYGK